MEEHALHRMLHDLFGLSTIAIIEQTTHDHVVPEQPDGAIPLAAAHDLRIEIWIVSGESGHSKAAIETGRISRVLRQARCLFFRRNARPQGQEADDLFTAHVNAGLADERAGITRKVVEETALLVPHARADKLCQSVSALVPLALIAGAAQFAGHAS